MQKKIFSPRDWENVHSDKPKTLKEWKRGADKSVCTKETTHNDTTQRDVETIIAQIETGGTDLTAGYENWRNIGFALADAFGERGRGYYHAVSRHNADYTASATDKQYNAILKSHGSGITIATFFKMAKDAGLYAGNMQEQESGKMDKWQNGNIQIAKCPNTQSLCTDDDAESPTPALTDDKCRWVKDENELPVIPDEVFDNLPSFLKEILQSANTNANRDIVLLGSLLVLSSTLHNTYGVYDDKIVYPNLYLFVAADAGMGKGALNLCRGLVLPIHKERLAIAREQMNEYRRQKAERKGSGGDEDLEPPGMYMHIIPANSSASSFQKILNDNGGIGLMFETEGDTLSNTLNNDMGNYSDVMRKAFHHEPISYSRRKDNEMVEIPCPKLSIALSGTPEQVQRLIPDTENGLMSRFIYYHLKFVKGFGHVFRTTEPSKSSDVVFELLGERYKRMREDYFRMAEVVYVLPQHLAMQFEEHFRMIIDDCVEEIEHKVQGLIYRMALIAFRIMMILSAMRTMSERTMLPTSNGKRLLECRDEEFRMALMICDTVFHHSIYYYMRLSKTVQQSMTRNSKRTALLDRLPASFTKQQYRDAACAMQLNESTTNKWLDAFIRQGQISRDAHGVYSKTSMR